MESVSSLTAPMVRATAAGERNSLACIWTGAPVAEHWTGAGRDVDFFDMKGLVERVSDALGVEISTEPHTEEWVVRGRAAVMSSN